MRLFNKVFLILAIASLFIQDMALVIQIDGYAFRSDLELRRSISYIINYLLKYIYNVELYLQNDVGGIMH
jgi:hypothetical protein